MAIFASLVLVTLATVVLVWLTFAERLGLNAAIRRLRKRRRRGYRRG